MSYTVANGVFKLPTNDFPYGLGIGTMPFVSLSTVCWVPLSVEWMTRTQYFAWAWQDHKHILGLVINGSFEPDLALVADAGYSTMCAHIASGRIGVISPAGATEPAANEFVDNYFVPVVFAGSVRIVNTSATNMRTYDRVYVVPPTDVDSADQIKRYPTSKCAGRMLATVTEHEARRRRSLELARLLRLAVEPNAQDYDRNIRPYGKPSPVVSFLQLYELVVQPTFVRLSRELILANVQTAVAVMVDGRRAINRVTTIPKNPATLNGLPDLAEMTQWSTNFINVLATLSSLAQETTVGMVMPDSISAQKIVAPGDICKVERSLGE